MAYFITMICKNCCKVNVQIKLRTNKSDLFFLCGKDSFSIDSPALAHPPAAAAPPPPPPPPPPLPFLLYPASALSPDHRFGIFHGRFEILDFGIRTNHRHIGLKKHLLILWFLLPPWRTRVYLRAILYIWRAYCCITIIQEFI